MYNTRKENEGNEKALDIPHQRDWRTKWGASCSFDT